MDIKWAGSACKMINSTNNYWGFLEIVYKEYKRINI